ncbi:DNA nucleotidylexotransferase-like [Ruditapes philippinarum]|uniref:DNA nucleotidylexotransferase-like n=1 Tax=Ruditapes philippinarum TaxID=129788 RepID=UPI00295BAF5A|nr:DNA nucleotidylexotransferase-like [Ruditapes philippinarum]
MSTSTKMESSSLVYILDAKIQKQRLKDMKNSASKRKIKVTDTFSIGVTHLVTEFKEYDQVLRKLDLTNQSSLDGIEVVTLQWFADCIRAGKVVDVEQKHRLQRAVTQRSEEVERPSQSSGLPEYACQRATPLQHMNEKYTKALEVLEKYADLRESDHDYSRALAFRRASCVLKSLPFALSSIQQLRNITNIGDHSKRVIQEILEDGECPEVENILKDPWFHKMKLFTEIFGIGPSTAKQFIAKGWSTINEVRNGHKSADWRVQWGLAFHEDLITPVVRQEACYIYELVLKHLRKVLPGAIATVTGGFRRGKASGHDVDILITHPTEDKVTGALPRLLHSLEATDTILHGRHERSTYTDDVISRNTKLSTRGQLDHFEKWIGIIKVPKKIKANSDNEGNGVVLNVNEGPVTDKSRKLCNGAHKLVNENTDVNEKDYDTVTNSTSVIYSRNGASENASNVMNLENEENLENDVSLDEVRNEQVASLEGSVDVTELRSVQGERSHDQTPAELAAGERDWLARRVDLIVAPYSQYYYALVGWTGSKQFNRDARTYSDRKLNMMLTSHGLYDKTLGKKIPASSEREVFDNLKLPYHEPWDRNC